LVAGAGFEPTTSGL